MTDTLEEELRALLAERAANMPAGATERLAQLDYQPRAGRLPRWPKRVWSLAGAGGAAMAGAIVAALLLLSSGGSSLVPLAYAGWSAVPTTPSPGELAKATASCRRLAGPLLRTAMTGRVVLTDKRGSYVAALYTHGRKSGVCISKSGAAVSGDGSAGILQSAPGPDQLSSPMAAGGGAPGFAGGAVEDHAYGRIGRELSAVTFIFAGNRTVEATVEHGWYFAWWPNHNWPVSLEVTTSSGIVTSPMGRQCSLHPRHCVFSRFEG